MMRWLIAVGLYLVSNSGVACELAGGETLELETGVTLHYRIEPSPLRVAQHFSMQFLVCRGAESLVPDDFKIDALMPTHGHGMNYKAKVTIQRDGRVETTGMLLHMPGAWQVVVNLSYDRLDRQVAIDYQL
jgi:hypothetical protein